MWNEVGILGFCCKCRVKGGIYKKNVLSKKKGGGLHKGTIIRKSVSLLPRKISAP